MELNEKKINWHIGIPVVLWIALVTLGIIKVGLSTAVTINTECTESQIKDLIYALVSTFNSNTFSTFISIIVCMLYQYFSTEKKAKREEVSGLAMKRIPIIFILTGVYSVVAVFDAAISNIVMAGIFFTTNIAYVICFFSLFQAKEKK